MKFNITKSAFQLLAIAILVSLFACEKEAIITEASNTEDTSINFRSEPTSLYAVTEYDPNTGIPSQIYEIDRSSGFPTGFSTQIYYNGMVVTDVIGICRMQMIGFNNGNPFYAVTLGPNSNVPQNPSVAFGIPDIRNGVIEFEFNDNDQLGVTGTYVKDIEWSDWGGLGLIGIEYAPTGGAHYLVDYATPHNVVRWEIVNVPASEEVRGLSWVYYEDEANFNCQFPPSQPIHHFDALDVTNGGTLPVPPSGLHTLYLTTLDAGVTKLYSLVFDNANNAIEAHFVQQLDPGAGVQIAQSELALGWDYANDNMYVGGNIVEAYNFGKLSSCPTDPWDLQSTSGQVGWTASIADITSQPFGF